MTTQTNALRMQDPTKQYPQPPFEVQEQSGPGLASDMKPTPDHGEESYVGHGRLEGRKALITGGDSGIGRAVAIAFAREGADVAINYLPEEQDDADEVLALIDDAGRASAALPGDIQSEDFCRKLVDDAVEALGGIDILVNVAGFQKDTPDIADITTEQFDQTMKTNVYAMFWLCKFALPHMPKGATIVNTASIQAYDPSESLIEYASTKAMNVAFTQGLAKQQAPNGIRVNAVAPGPIWTPLQPAGGQKPEAMKDFGSETPIGRPGQPAELASAYVYLASQESSYVTGETLAITGGLVTA